MATEKTGSNKIFWWLLAACIIAAGLRICLPWHAIFPGGHVNFSGPDSYYQMNIIRQVYEGAAPAGTSSFYAEWIIGLANIVSWGNPSYDLVEHVAVFVPVLLSVFTVIMVYLIGRMLHSKMAGIIGALAIAVLPGEYFGRSWLGAVDYHAMEVFLTTGVIGSLVCFTRVNSRLLKLLLVAAAGVYALAYYQIWPGAVGMLPVFLAFAGAALIQSLKPGKTGTRIMGSVFVLCLILLGVFLFTKVSSFPSFTLANTAETQPGFTDYLVLLHIFLVLIFAVMYWKDGGHLRLPVVFWVGYLVIATLWQRRFDYYLTIPFALLLGTSLTAFYREISSWSAKAPAAAAVKVYSGSTNE